MKNPEHIKILNGITESLNYEVNAVNCSLIHARLRSTGIIYYFLYLYLVIFNLFKFSRLFINLNQKFILFKFISGVIILVYESESNYIDNAPEEIKFSNYPEQIYDTVVVGSGPGGSIAALRLLEKGEKVAIIESGSAYNAEQIEQHSLDQTTYQFNKQGMTFCLGNIPMLFAEGATFGGGSEVNSGLYFKLTGPHRQKFLKKSLISELEWNKTEKIVENMISVQKAPEKTYVNIDSALIRGSNKVGLVCEEIPRWRTYSPSEVSQTMQVTYLKKAEKLGLEIYTNSKLNKIIPEKDKIMLKISIKGGKNINLSAKKVVLAAGTIGTPTILKNSKLIKDKIKFNFHPMLRCVVDYGKRVNDGDLFPSFQAWTKDYIYKFGYSVSTFPFLRAVLASYGNYEDMENKENYVSYFSSTTFDKSLGRIFFINNKAFPFMYISRKDKNKLKQGFEILKQTLIKGGVKEVWPKKGLPPLTTVHIFGSLPLNKNRDIGQNGELKIDKRIKICDSSILPIAPWGNPQAVMMVLNEILLKKWIKSF